MMRAGASNFYIFCDPSNVPKPTVGVHGTCVYKRTRKPLCASQHPSAARSFHPRVGQARAEVVELMMIEARVWWCIYTRWRYEQWSLNVNLLVFTRFTRVPSGCARDHPRPVRIDARKGEGTSFISVLRKCGNFLLWPQKFEVKRF